MRSGDPEETRPGVRRERRKRRPAVLVRLALTLVRPVRPIRLVFSARLAFPAWFAVLTWLGATGPARADILEVRPDGTGAYPSIQAAIDAAQQGDIIELADGTFTGPGNHDADFLGKSITVRSAAQDPEVCIIDCQQAGRAFYFHSEEDVDATLFAVTITGGDADAAPVSPGIGGGILLDRASPTLNLCIIEGNRATQHGGGLAFVDGANSDLVDCVIRNNRLEGAPGPGASRAAGGAAPSVQDAGGAGIYCQLSSPPSFTCFITGNVSLVGPGGGVFLDAAAPILTGATISGNSSPSFGGGGVACENNARPVFAYCDVSGNVAGTEGGGVRGDQGAQLIFTGSLVRGNEAQTGGGVYAAASLVNLTDTRIQNNRGAGLVLAAGSSGTLEGATITGNAGSGEPGGVAVLQSLLTIGTTTIAGNLGRLDAAAGGLVLADATVEMDRTIVWGNCLDASGTATQEIFAGGASLLTCTCCALDEPGTGGDGTIEYDGEQVFSDPLFCAPRSCEDAPSEAGDYTLSASSPCLAENSPCGERIGAAEQGCDNPTSILSTSWGRLKSRFGR